MNDQKYIGQLMGESRATFALAIPLMIGNITFMLVAWIDTLMIGRLGVTELAATTFANNILHLPFMFGIGVGIAVSIRVSQARGADDPPAARAALRHGLFLGFATGIIAFCFALGLIPFLYNFGQDPEVVALAPNYFLLVAASMIPAMGSVAIKNHSDAMNRPWPAFWVLFSQVPLNAFLNWVFIFGNLGAPAMGIDGAGLATLIARVITLSGLILLCQKSKALDGWVPVHWFKKPDWGAVGRLLKVGIPASLQILAESSSFVAATVMIGWLGKTELACHQVAITCVATVFMVPLGMSQALTVRVGEAWGAKQYQRLKTIALSGWAMTSIFALATVPLFVGYNVEIARWFMPTADDYQLSIAAGLLLAAAVFQVSDSLQVVSAGFLRGLDDVRVPALLSFLAYWGIALPIGYVLSFNLDLGVNGMWFGITFGLTFTFIVLSLRVWRKVHRRVEAPIN